MAHEENAGYIKLISCVEPTLEQRNDANYIPQMQVSQEALKIICEQFETPISILVYIGSQGIGKSKLASLTVAALQNEKCDKSLRLFHSGHNVSNVTDGVWMWRTPLKAPNQNKKKGSILLLDCEGLDELDKNRSDNFYLFCMIISTAFAVILRPPRAASVRWDRLNNTLRHFERMDTPYVLPNLWLVPLDLIAYTDNDQEITPREWLNRSFNVNTLKNTLSTAELQRNEEQCNYIRNMLPKMNVVNVGYLPEIFRNDKVQLADMFTLLRQKPCEEYYNALRKALDQFIESGGKRLPGSASHLSFVRPAELANIMGDLIEVLNRQKTSNADELIGKYLLTRFNEEVATEQIAKFKNKLLLFADRYAKENLEQEETDIQKEETNAKLNQERIRLTKQHMEEMKKLAVKKIYGSGSKLLELNHFTEKLNNIERELDQYKDPDIFIDEIRNIYKNKDKKHGNQETRREILSEETLKKIERLKDLIYREERINDSIMPDEETGELKGQLKVELEPCLKCHRSAISANLIHTSERCPSGRNGDYFRYHTTTDHMVCDACRQIEKISVTQVKCTKCGYLRFIKRLI